MITNQQADILIKIKKRIIINNTLMERVSIENNFPLQLRFSLIADNTKFLWEISQSRKNNVKISLHFQDDENKIGLFRIDYNSGHKNPETALPDLPLIFKPYIGKWFDSNEHHAHYYVYGYKPLAWAIPLTESDFKVKNIKNPHSDFINAIINFAEIINLETKISFNSHLI